MTQQLPDVEDIVWSGGGAKSAEWVQVGAWVGGPVQSRPKSYEAKEYVPGQPGAGRPRLTQNGEKIYGIKVDVLTGQRDPSDPKDDGVRRMHLEKWRQLEAVRHALMEAGVRHIEPGGELWVQWTGEERDGQTAQAAKTWTAKYRPPANSAARILDPEPAPVATQQVAPPQAAPQAAQAPQAAPWQGGGGMPQPAPAGPPQPAVQPQGPAWAGPQADSSAYTPAPPAPAPPAPAAAPAPAAGGGLNVITESVAAALRASGVDTSRFTIVPG